MGVRVGQLTPRVELIELCAIAGQRPPSIGRHPVDDAGQRKIEPHHGTIGQHQRTIIRFGKRAAAGGDDDVALGEQLAECLPLELPEMRFALLREDRGDRSPLVRLDSLVDVLHTPPRGSSHCTRHRTLACPHESDQIEFVCLHARSDSRTVKNSGYDTAAAPASAISVGPEAPSAATANAIARRWSLRASTSPPLSRRVPRT